MSLPVRRSDDGRPTRSGTGGLRPIDDVGRLPRNDVAQYDDLAGEWWRPGGAFAMLHWIAKARARLIPPAGRPGAVLLDAGCGAGLLAPHVARKGYRHVGVDLVASALAQAVDHGVVAVRADVTALPLAAGSADVVSAGEVLEHVPDLAGTVAQLCRVLRPGGLFVADTLNATAVARLVAVTVGERLPGAAPPGIHDPALFVSPRRLVAECARHGVRLRVRGIRPAVGPLLRWFATRRGEVPIVPTRSTAVLYQARGVRT
jgi:2-polyprenyl-6-hydroxyphenyl methylase/3-demethylubiquinone-9 3-methyltransferase